MKRSLKLKEVEARKKLTESDIKVLRALESKFLQGDPLTLEREQLRRVIRNKDKP